MHDTMTYTIELIRKSLTSLIKTKKPHTVLYEINVNQGGIGEAKITVKSDLRGEEEK